MSCFLQYLSDQERANLTAHSKDLEIQEVATIIKDGNWAEKNEWNRLFKEYGKSRGKQGEYALSYWILNAYRQRLIDLDEAATAMLFHS